MASTFDIIRKIRCFVIGRSSGQPLAGITVSLTAEFDDQHALPIGLLTSDKAGYVSFDLAPLGHFGSVARLVLLAIADPSSQVDLLKLLPGKSNSSDEWLSSIKSKLSAEQLGQSKSKLSDAQLSTMLSGPFHFLVNDKIPRASCGTSVLPSIQSPDPRDYEVSVYSFVNRPVLKLGDECCESLSPTSLPVQEFRFTKVITRSLLAPKEPPQLNLAEAFTISNPTRMQVPLVDVSVNPVAGPAELKFGEALDFRQRWFSLGHSLGEIKYSLALAPGESTEIAVIDFSREDSISRTDEIRATENLRHRQNRERTIDESVNAMLMETQDGSSFMAGLGVAVSMPVQSAQIGGNLAIGGGISHSSGFRNTEADSLQDLHDRTLQVTGSIRTLSSTVVIQASQKERNEVQTRKVGNHNHCHALTVQYYEVLRQFRVMTEFVRRRKVLLIPFAPFNFDWQTAVRFRTILEKALLDPLLSDSFNAMARLRLGFSMYAAGAEVGNEITEKEISSNEQYFVGEMEFILPDPNVPSPTGKRIQKGSEVSITAEGFVRYKADLGTGVDPDGRQNLANRDYVAPGLREESLICKIGEDFYQGGKSEVFTAKRDGSMVFLVNDTIGSPKDNSGQYSGTVTVIAPVHDTDSEENASNTTTANPSKDKAIGDNGTSTSSVPTADRDAFLEAVLLAHLNGNRGYYNRAVWFMMDSSDRRMHLEKALADKPEMLDVLDDTPLAISGHWVAFPYDGAVPGWEEIRPDDPALPLDSIVTLPTRGVFAEAMLGHCNACEKRDVTRMWDWTQMTTETPPSISSVTPGPKGQVPDITPGSLPQNVIQIAQPLSAPDPAGLAKALDLIGKGDAFRDMSGLDEVGSMLENLANNATSLAQAQQMAKNAKNKLDSSVKDGERKESDSPETQYDRLQIAKEIVKAAPELELSQDEKKDAVTKVLTGQPGVEKTTEPKTGVVSIPSSRSTGASAKTVTIFLLANDSNGTPYGGTFDLDILGAGGYRETIRLSTDPALTSKDPAAFGSIGADEKTLRLPTGHYTFQGTTKRTRLPDAAAQDIEVPIVGPNPTLHIKPPQVDPTLYRNLNGSFDVISGTSAVTLYAKLNINKSQHEQEITLGASVNADLTREIGLTLGLAKFAEVVGKTVLSFTGNVTANSTVKLTIVVETAGSMTVSDKPS